MDFRVGFLIAGAQKCGTTALYEALRRHPQIGMSRLKEPHFFDNEALFAGGAPDYGLYHAAFDATGGRKIYGEATPIYLYWQDAPRRIWEYNPQMRIIVLLRNPVERAWSQWRMEFERGNERLPFGEAIRREPERCREALPLQHRVYSYVDRGFYSEQLRRLWRFFPPEQTLVLQQRQLLEDPGAALERVCAFLGVDPPRDLAVPAGAAAPPPPAEDADYLVRLFRPEVCELERMLGWDLADWKEGR